MNYITSVEGKIKDFLNSNKESIKTLVEIGTHFGTDTIELRKILPKSEIFCFEPDPRNIKVIEKFWDGQNIANIYELALSNFNGKTKFYLSSGDCSFWTNDELLSNNDWSASNSLKKPIKHLERHSWITFDNTIEVNCIRLDDFEPLKNKIIDFIWMDVQGAEELVIEGSIKTLNNTKFLYTEYSNEELYEGQLDLNSLLTLLGESWETLEVFNNDVLLKNKKFE